MERPPTSPDPVRLTAGQRVWVIRDRDIARPYTVLRVAKKWATVKMNGRYSREETVTATADDRGAYYMPQGKYSPLRVYTDAQLANRSRVLLLAESRRKAIDRLSGSTPDVSPETTLAVCRLLGVEVPATLPTDDDVIAGAVAASAPK